MSLAVRQGRSGAGGFTLIEIIVVMVIMALIAGLVMVRGPVRSDRFELDATARALTGALRLARGQAIAGNKVVVVRTSAAGFAVDDGAMWRLGDGQTMSPSTVIFTPEGQSSGGAIAIASRSGRVAVKVDWLTGRVWVETAVGERTGDL